MWVRLNLHGSRGFAEKSHDNPCEKGSGINRDISVPKDSKCSKSLSFLLYIPLKR
jgi:hypothetical protein